MKPTSTCATQEPPSRVSKTHCQRFFKKITKFRMALLLGVGLVLSLWIAYMTHVQRVQPTAVHHKSEKKASNVTKVSEVKTAQEEPNNKRKANFDSQEKRGQAVDLQMARKVTNENADAFLQATANIGLNRVEKQIYLRTLALFDRVWRKDRNLTYFLYGETLFGAARHKGFIPWDDDIDLLIDVKDRSRLEEVFNNTELGVKKQRYGKNKVFLKALRPGMRPTWVGWNWPFLDVYCFTFKDQGSRLQTVGDANFSLKTSDVFPPRFLIFEGYSLPAPRCLNKALECLFGPGFMQTCCSHSYRHRWENLNYRQTCVTCATSKNFYHNFTWTSLDSDPNTCEK